MRASLVVAVSLLATTAFAEPRHLSVDDAVKLALETNPRLQSAEAHVRAGHAIGRSVGARMLPSIHLSEEYQFWDSAFSVKFALSPTMVFPFTVRDQGTNTFAAAADQPLLGLLHLAEDYRAQKRTAEAGDAAYRAGEAQVREAIATGYLRYFEARSLEEIARSSEAELDGQVAVAQARVKAGELTNADVLRVSVAAANARQQEIFARTQGEIAFANLMAAIGLAPDEPNVVLDEPKELLVAARERVPEFRDAAALAEQHRPEVKQSRLLLEAGDHTQKARMLSLLPEVNAEAVYTNLTGQVFAPANAFFVGVKATWAIWEWGASWFQQRAAVAQAEAAKANLESTRRQVATEVKVNLSQSDAAAAQVDLAEKTIVSAEEAYRVTDALVKAGSATTTDLLDSQSALTGARLSLARARYEQAIARVSLSRVIGD